MSFSAPPPLFSSDLETMRGTVLVLIFVSVCMLQIADATCKNHAEWYGVRSYSLPTKVRHCMGEPCHF